MSVVGNFEFLVEILEFLAHEKSDKIKFKIKITNFHGMIRGRIKLTYS